MVRSSDFMICNRYPVGMPPHWSPRESNHAVLQSIIRGNFVLEKWNLRGGCIRFKGLFGLF